MRKPALSLITLALAVGCGGKAFFDGEPQGSGGSGGAGGGSGNGNGSGGSPLCVTPPPVGATFLCGGGAVVASTVTTGPSSSCESTNCDGAGNSWRAACSGQACTCFYNDMAKCNCAVNDGTQFCTPGVNACCPTPWPK